MSETTDLIDAKYQHVYEEELRGLQRRCEHDPSCSLKDLSGVLHNLYIMDGNNWEGRSEMLQASISATIAAYEHFIAEMKKDQSQ